ncbi:HDIG domain-containing protein [bacterium]|nr:HDIG domain-containing protein [bacterium]
MTVVVLSVLLSLPLLLPNQVSLKLGDMAPDNIIAQRTARYEDTSETEMRRTQAAGSVGKVYDPVPNAADQSVGALKTIFRTVEDTRSSANRVSASAGAVKVRSQLGSLIGSHVSDPTLAYLLAISENDLRDVEDNVLRIVSATMGREIREDPADMRDAREKAMREATKLLHDQRKALVVGEIAQDVLRPNRIYNEERTIALQEKARKKVQPVNRLITRGDLVIAKGEPVLQEHLDKFEALGLTHPTLDYRSILCYALLVILMMWIVVTYLLRYHPDVYANTRAMWLLALIAMVSTLALRVGGSMLGINLSPAHVGYLGILWVVVAGMFMAVLINPQVSVVIVALLSIVLSLLLNNELKYATTALITALVGIYSVANIRDRHDLMRAGGALAAVGVLLVWITGGLGNDNFTTMMEGTFWAGVIIPLVTVSLFFFGTVPLERPFGRTTHISLLELADTNKPLLRRLVMEAPGTYTHCMTVGHLAESAAESIGADPLVARVASYYHDIGKIRRPHFFIENQNIENVHDRMNPTLSALVITSHIKDGVDIAQEFRVPKVVLDVISQHHGTSLVQYFYNQYTGEQEPSTAVEQQFRYPGPKPQTKEAAVVMLADAVEAASRGLAKPTPSKIELLVNRIVADKLRDGQLDESDLTFKDLSKISEGFVRTLVSINHARIDYGEAEARKTADADSDSELTKDTGEGAQDPERGPTAAAS